MAPQSDQGRLQAGLPIRLALVTSSYNYIADGVALTLNRLVAYLESQGVQVLVFTPVGKAAAFAHQGEIVPVPSIAAPFRPEYRLASGLGAAARARLTAFAPDIIHIATPDILGHQALSLGSRMGVPVVASFHTRYETYLDHYGLGFLGGFVGDRMRDFYRQCREVYVPSDSMAEVLRREGVSDHVELWTRGVDVVRFHPGKRSVVWRAAHGLTGDDVAILFASRLVREKRLATLVDMFSRLRGAGVPHKAIIVGDGPERANLEAALPQAKFLGFLTGDDLPYAYAGSDIFAFPSDTETFGSVTLEAMASGLPTICADATGSRSLVSPGETGFLVDAADGEGFFGAAARLARGPALRRSMGAAARTRSLDFSWDAAMAGLLARYRAVIAETPAAQEPCHGGRV